MKYNDLAAEIKTPVFSRQDLLIKGLKVYDYQFNLWTKKGLSAENQKRPLRFCQGHGQDPAPGNCTATVRTQLSQHGNRPGVVRVYPGGWFTPIPASPPSILLAQKMITVLLRKREKGRDLFDVSFLRGLAQPDYDYIERCWGWVNRNSGGSLMQGSGRWIWNFWQGC